MPKTSEAKRAFKNKGYREDKDTHHEYLYFYYQGVRTEIKTYFSHRPTGSDLRPNELRGMKNQLKFQTNKQVEDFISCTLSEEQYIEILRAGGHLDPYLENAGNQGNVAPEA